MKKFLFILLTAALTACSSLTPAEKAERQARIAKAVEYALAERHYTVDIVMMYPTRGKAVNVAHDYSLEVRGDTLVSYLPYFGRAYSVPYGGGKGLNFTAPIMEYRSEKGRRGSTTISMKVRNEEDLYMFTLDVFDDGNTSIDVRPQEREPISYSGNMMLSE